MAKTVYDIMVEKNARENISAFMQKMSLPYEAKLVHAKRRAEEFYHEICDVRGANVHVSVGGLDYIGVKWEDEYHEYSAPGRVHIAR